MRSVDARMNSGKPQWLVRSRRRMQRRRSVVTAARIEARCGRCKKAAAGPGGRGRPLLQTRLRGGRGNRDASRSSGAARIIHFKPSTAAIRILPRFRRHDNAAKFEQSIWCDRTAAEPTITRASRRSPALRVEAARRDAKNKYADLSVKKIAAGPGGRPAAYCEPRLREGDKPGRKTTGLKPPPVAGLLRSGAQPCARASACPARSRRRCRRQAAPNASIPCGGNRPAHGA